MSIDFYREMKKMNLSNDIRVEIFNELLTDDKVDNSFILDYVEDLSYIDNVNWQRVIRGGKRSSAFWKHVAERRVNCFLWDQVFQYQDLDEDFLSYFIDTHKTWWDEGWSDYRLMKIFQNMSQFQVFSFDFAVKYCDYLKFNCLYTNYKIEPLVLEDILNLRVYLRMAE